MSRPGPKTTIQTLVLMNEDITTDELHAELASLGMHPTKYAVGKIRSSFLAVLKLLRSLDVLKDEKPGAPLWLRQHRKRLKREAQRRREKEKNPHRFYYQ